MTGLGGVRKYGAIVSVSDEVLNPRPATGRKAAELDAYREAYRAALDALRAALAIIPAGPLAAVADLHTDRDGECRGCDVEGWEAEFPEWPCRTAALLGEQLGVKIP